jgi:antitoxin ParD1/3/4
MTIMRTTQQFSITLPDEIADALKEKVASGEYANESEVVRDGLRLLLSRQCGVDQWLLEQVAPAYDAIEADSSRSVSVESVRARLAKEHKAASEKK